ncbi:ogr/Delta-like zinc finger family protein [Pararhodospirillum photometricum]|uniref:ogr/Delta-like zinc finger family protein n=1 Tax=Pararhodospirillum photometricum TaxID=1084 RepID=UPI000304ACDA|nr:ogr/Delta-like zinc finger family protein [Pararhodospirillum photometricum]
MISQKPMLENRRPPYDGARTACPACRTLARTVKTEQLTEIVREVTYRCSNPDCLCSFKAQITVIRVLHPSLCASLPDALSPIRR